jgi:hypothetical protein
MTEPEAREEYGDKVKVYSTSVSTVARTLAVRTDRIVSLVQGNVFRHA